MIPFDESIGVRSVGRSYSMDSATMMAMLSCACNWVADPKDRGVRIGYLTKGADDSLLIDGGISVGRTRGAWLRATPTDAVR